MGYWSDKAIEVAEFGKSWLQTEKQSVCADCLNEKGIVDFIESNAVDGQCSYCGTAGRVASMSEVVPHIRASLSLEWASPDEELPYDREDGIWLFGEPISTYELLGTLIFHDYDGTVPQALVDDITTAMPLNEWAAIDAVRTTKTELLTNSWQAFCHVVKHERRYFFGLEISDKIILNLYGDEVQLGPQQLLQLILEFLRDQRRLKTMPKGWQVMRCQPKDPNAEPFDAIRMGPPPLEFATQSNRMSPAGVSMFYGSTDRDVCLREIADEAGYFACGTFEVDRETVLIDLTGKISIPSLFDQNFNKDRPLWSFIRHFLDDFRKPIVKDGREHIEYVPTQVVSEYFRSSNHKDIGRISGVLYDCSRVPGKDAVVLFADSSSITEELDSAESIKLKMVNYEELEFTP